MAEFYVHENGLLVSHGFAQDGQEALQALPGQTVVIGSVPGYTQEPLPHRGAKWHVEKRCWVDTRTEDEKHMHEQEAMAAARRATYPSLMELADALYWQAQGDESKLQSYLTRCAQANAVHPKPSLLEPSVPQNSVASQCH